MEEKTSLTKKSKTKITPKGYLILFTGFCVGLPLATILEDKGYLTLGWFLAGVIISIGMTYAYIPEKRWGLKSIAFHILTGTVMVGVTYITKYYNL